MATAGVDAPGQTRGTHRRIARLNEVGRPAQTGRPAVDATEPFPISAVYPRGGRCCPKRAAGRVGRDSAAGARSWAAASSRNGVRCAHRDRPRRPLRRKFWPSEIGVRATGFARSGWTAGRSCRTSSSTGKCRANERDAVPLVVDERGSDRLGRRLRNRRGVSRNGPRASRGNLET